MSAFDEKLLARLHAAFQVEAEEHLQAISGGLLELEQNRGSEQPPAIVENVFRAAHSLKGAARVASRTDIEAVCQSLESVFAAWKRAGRVSSREELDSALHTVDVISALLTGAANQAAVPVTPAPVSPPPGPSVAGTGSPATAPGTPATASAGRAPGAELPAAPDKLPTAETVRVASAKLETLLLQAEEMLAVKLIAGQRAGELRDVGASLDEWRREWGRVAAEVRTLRPEHPAVADFLEWHAAFLQTLDSRLQGLAAAAAQDFRAIGKLVDDLLADSKRLVMMPFATLLGLFPKLVRDLCRDQGKTAELVIRGGELEIDKRILDEMKDPLVHLLRNALDHGLEKPAERAARGKPAAGTLTIAVAQVEGNKVEVLVRDDGGGVNIPRLKEVAVERGALTAAQTRQLSDAEALPLMFYSGVSTSPLITEISGRGLGMAIVREKAERLGGHVAVHSEAGCGTTFRIVLPTTLATCRGILVEVAGQVLVIPAVYVERVGRIAPADIRTIMNRETIAWHDRAVALVRMAEVLELPRDARRRALPACRPVIVLGAGDERMAFVVDAVLHEEEVLVKRLSRPLVRVRNVAGVTVLGSGRVVPILNVADLLKSAVRVGDTAPAGGAPQRPPENARRKAVLVVEDSITARMLVKNILETAGYEVKTAVDGQEAWTALHAEAFDAVVSDIEMPRMNGFELTARIRAQKELAGLPVVLVTALASREDRERGVEAGANAYIVKNNFEQSKLLEILGRMV